MTTSPGPGKIKLKRHVRVYITIICLALLLSFGGGAGFDGPYPVQAQQVDHHAGLVIQFADGTTQEYCLTFAGDSISGFDLLLKTGLDVKAEGYGPMGGEVCKIGPDGCDFPGQPCACLSYGPGGVYWTYHHLKDGKWVTSALGAGTSKVHGGDVDGWAWSDGKGPSVVPTFAGVCMSALGAPTTTRTPVATHTATAIPARPTASSTPRPKPSASPTPRPIPRQTFTMPTEATATMTLEELTPTPTLQPLNTDTPTLLPPTDTHIPQATGTPTEPPTATPGPPPSAPTNSDSSSQARTVAILVGLLSAAGLVLWRVFAGARTGRGDGRVE